MKISRLLKTIFMIDFVTGLLIAIKETFKAKKTINYPFEKGSLEQGQEVSMLLEDILTVKKDA